MTNLEKFEKDMTTKQLTHEFNDNGLICKIQPHFGGLNWSMKNSKGDTLSIYNKGWDIWGEEAPSLIK